MHVDLSNDCPLVLIIILPFGLVLVSHPYILCAHCYWVRYISLRCVIVVAIVQHA